MKDGDGALCSFDILEAAAIFIGGLTVDTSLHHARFQTNHVHDIRSDCIIRYPPAENV
jgi:hypothetical protein